MNWEEYLLDIENLEKKMNIDLITFLSLWKQYTQEFTSWKVNKQTNKRKTSKKPHPVFSGLFTQKYFLKATFKK